MRRNLRFAPKDRTYFVYILASKNRTIYTGITNDLERRVEEHMEGLVPGFTRRYRVTHLVYYEEFDDPDSAIAREKVIKAWRRSKKTALIESVNPQWKDLADDWFDE
ncbi:MAG: GIY-YIG nuclease family protein [bacterium]